MARDDTKKLWAKDETPEPFLKDKEGIRTVIFKTKFRGHTTFLIRFEVTREWIFCKSRR